jgi:hypothetical protein
MATKNASSVGFWAVVIGGGFLILLLGSFSWYQAPKMGARTMMGTPIVGFGSAGQTFPVGAPMMDAFYGTKSASESAFISPSPMPPIYGGGGDTAATATPRIIKKASLTLEVKSSRESATMVANVAKLNNGFVESSNVVENQDGTVSAYITIRVPEAKFDDTISSLTGLALRVTTQTINGQDVTEQYTDLEARLKSAKAVEEQYLEILKKATKIEDILSVTERLNQIRYEIDSVSGQIKYLGNQTTYSSISVSLTEQANLNIPAGKFDLGRDLKQAGQAVILLAEAFLTFAVWFVIIGSALAIPSALIIFVVYKLVRRLIK